jgi:hypothetical protein
MLMACALAATLQVVYFTGVAGSDDMAYLRVAEEARTGQLAFAPNDHLAARVVVWKPAQLVASVLPGSALAMALPSTVAVWILLLTIAWLDARRGNGVGWIAMALLAVVPVNVVIASALLPDGIGSALGWLGVAIAAGPMLNRESRGGLWRCALAGLIVAMGYNAKEPVLFFIPGMLLYVLITHPRERWAWSRAAALACGAGLWMGLEMAWLWHASGDPLFHAHAMSLSQRGFVSAPVERTLRGLLTYWTQYGRRLAQPTSDFGPAGPILLVGAVVAVAIRTPWTKFLLCTIAPAALYLSAGSTDFTRYTPIIQQSRYFVPILPGLALIAAAVLAHNWRAHPRWRPVMCVAGCMLLAGSLVAPNRIAGKWYHAETFQAGQPILREYADQGAPGTRLCASDLTRSRFAGLARWFRFPEIELIQEPPRTPAEWSACYGGADVLVSRFDRVKPADHHLYRSLYGPAINALSGFERVNRNAPPTSRLAAIRAWISGGCPPEDAEYAVEIWRIPPAPSSAPAQSSPAG